MVSIYINLLVFFLYPIITSKTVVGPNIFLDNQNFKNWPLTNFKIHDIFSIKSANFFVFVLQFIQRLNKMFTIEIENGTKRPKSLVVYILNGYH